MIDIIKSKLAQVTVLVASLVFATVLAMPALASAQAVSSNPNIQDSLCTGAADLQFQDSSSTSCEEAAGGSGQQVNKLVGQIINIFSIVVGIVAVIMIIYGGFRYITSGGDSGNVTNAKNTILYAIIGLVIVALAQFIVKFVLGKATGAGTD